MVYVRQLAYEALRSALRSMTLRVYVVWAVTDAIEAGYLKSRRFSCRFDAPHLVYQARSEKTLTYLTYLLVYRYALLEPAFFSFNHVDSRIVRRFRPGICQTIRHCAR
jgi:hypothetical protein